MSSAAALVDSVEAEDTPLYPRRDSGAARPRSLAASTHDAVAALIACVGAMSMGFCLGYSSPALQDRQLKQILDTTARQSWFGSLLTVGAMAGGPLGALLAGHTGRKLTLIICNVPLVIGWFLIIYATNVVLLYTGRYTPLAAHCSVSVSVCLSVCYTSSLSFTRLLDNMILTFVKLH